jgi:hypothetical protein
MAIRVAARWERKGGIQYILVNIEARRSAGVKAWDVLTIALEPDTEKREIEIRTIALCAKLSQKLNDLSFTLKKEFTCGHSKAQSDRRFVLGAHKNASQLSGQAGTSL